MSVCCTAVNCTVPYGAVSTTQITELCSGVLVRETKRVYSSISLLVQASHSSCNSDKSKTGFFTQEVLDRTHVLADAPGAAGGFDAMPKAMKRIVGVRALLHALLDVDRQFAMLVATTSHTDGERQSVGEKEPEREREREPERERERERE